MNHLLCISASDLNTDERELAQLSASEQGKRRALRAAFWQQWSEGKPVIVTGVSGRINWHPNVRPT
jgi:hypothetical protein